MTKGTCLKALHFFGFRGRHSLIMLCAVLCLFMSPAQASCPDEGLAVSHAQIRATAPNAPVAAGYLQIINQTGRTQTLVAASAPFSKRAEIHDMKQEGGVMKMFELDGGLVLPDGLAVKLMPGGRHLMFMGLDRQLKDGERFDVTLTFAPCGVVTLPFDVVKMPAQMKGHSHSQSHNH